MEEAAAIAVIALRADAGCEEARAKALVKAIGEAAREEALELVAGSTQPFSGVLDRRVATLERVIRLLDEGERLPSDYEVGAIFRITPTQGRNVLRTYQARFSESYRNRLQGALGEVDVQSKLVEKVQSYVAEFTDPALLEFAVEKLRRRGLTRSVTVDRVKLRLVVARDQRDRFDKDAKQALRA
jgi:hypothetical protein